METPRTRDCDAVRKLNVLQRKGQLLYCVAPILHSIPNSQFEPVKESNHSEFHTPVRTNINLILRRAIDPNPVARLSGGPWGSVRRNKQPV